MSLVSVYSRAPIAHQFEIFQNGVANIYVIKGTNSHQIMGAGADVPYITQMEESVFNQIKEEYKSHANLFGGSYPNSREILSPLIYTAKSDADAKKKMNDSKPVLTVNEVAHKSGGIEKFSTKD